MKAIILAAGMGSRLGEYTKENTKAMVKVNNKTLIERNLDILNNNGIQEVIIVVGYKREGLINYLGNSYKNINIKYIINSEYNKTNNIYSLYLAKEEFNDDILLLESDIIFEDKIIKDLLEDKNETLVLVDKYQSFMDGTVVTLDENNYITEFINKDQFNYGLTDNYYKTVNIYKFSKEFLNKKYLPYLEAYIKSEGMNEYYEQVLKVISSLKSTKLMAKVIDNEKWYEIDDAQDLDIAETIFSDETSKLKNMQKRYGGYWRFPKVKDYCYLVNPYFPSSKMMEEMKSSFTDLIRNYPSGLNIQNLLGAKLVKCNINKILVGNGAAELIKATLDELKGNVMTINPTFNEYKERVKNAKVYEYDSSINDFNYSVEDIINYAKDLDISNLIIINPDNPTGHYFSKEEIMELLDFCKEKNIKLILDESFIDFAGKGLTFSLFDDSILDKYTNLIVIKSISKSYGVPGLRLGILGCSDFELINNIRKNMPIWNINSFGEFFMQIIGKYTSDYEKACEQISSVRDDFYKKLQTIDYLKVYNSKSNYFLCKVDKYTSTELSNILLNKHNILIKDCYGKAGFSDNNYIRIAVRTKEENNDFIKVLNSLSL